MEDELEPRLSPEEIEKVNEVLDKIDEVLSGRSLAGKALWLILTAQRGPDHGGDDDKMTFTVPVRRAAFPKNSIVEWGAAGAMVGKRFDIDPTHKQLDERNTQGHFYSHAYNAWKYLRQLGRVKD